MEQNNDIRANVAAIREKMAEAARSCGRDPKEIKLCAATKMNDAARVKEAVAAGVDCCGENRVQELLEKQPQGAYEGAPVHFIGHLQTNKVKQVVGRVDLIESVDRTELLECVEKQAAKLGLVQDILLEVNIGAEETKGGALQHETYKLLKKASEEGRINFVGNVEGSTMLLGGVDVVVSDGFSGNIVLKTAEGVAKWLFTELKEVFMMSTKNKLAAAVIKGDVKGIAKKIDPNEVGGTAFLGISKPVIKAHGSSGDEAFFAAIRQAKAFAEADIVSDIENNIDYMKISEEA